ncbi:hypothetical protein WAI453_003806 [Rhynchosporium graminicola]
MYTTKLLLFALAAASPPRPLMPTRLSSVRLATALLSKMRNKWP